MVLFVASLETREVRELLQKVLSLRKWALCDVL